MFLYVLSTLNYPFCVKIIQNIFGNLGYFSYFYDVIKVKNMSKNYVQLPDSFYKGLICKVHVSLNGNKGTKELKVCSVKARSIIFIEIDKANRQNIFRKVDRKDIVKFTPTAICEITVRDGILPVKWESAWDSIGSFSPNVRNYGRMAVAAKPFRSTVNVNGFPMV